MATGEVRYGVYEQSLRVPADMRLILETTSPRKEAIGIAQQGRLTAPTPRPGYEYVVPPLRPNPAIVN